VAVHDDAEAEDLIRGLREIRYTVDAIVEQEAVGRLATAIDAAAAFVSLPLAMPQSVTRCRGPRACRRSPDALRPRYVCDGNPARTPVAAARANREH